MHTFIDSHAHFDAPVFNINRTEQLAAIKQAGIQTIIIPGTTPSQWNTAQALSQQHSQLYFSVGLHPYFLHNAPSDWSKEIERQIKDERCIAIGECGLDKRIDTPIATQQAFFEQHVKLAQQHALPLIIHSVKTHPLITQILKQHSLHQAGVIHAFSGSYEAAKTFWDMGFYLGVGGTITYPRAKKTREAIRKMPLESLLLETDAPDMPLHGKQGQSNSPLYIPEVATCLAELKSTTLEKVAKTTTENTLRLFTRINQVPNYSGH